MYSNAQQLKEIIKVYTSDVALLKHPIVIAIFLTIYYILLIADGYYYVLLLAIGFGLGTFIAYNKQSEFTSTQYERHLSYVTLDLEKIENTSGSKEVILFYSPLTKIVNQLLDYIVNDFVLSWWSPLNLHHDNTFETLAREKLNTIVLNIQTILLSQERNDIVMSTVYGVANTLIIHMRECRALEESKLTIDDYVLDNPQSPFGQLYSKDDQHRQLKALSQTFFRRTLAGPDRDSQLMMSLLNELLANFLLGSILDSFSDPDYLNLWIIDLLSEKQPVIELPGLEEERADDSSVSSSYEEISPIIFERGSVQFTVMDISTSLQKNELTYIIQIERPATEEQSEGGGYVITRTYLDFETLHTLLSSRHSIGSLKLPLDSAWRPVQQKRMSLNTISIGLERYLTQVVADEVLGTDPILVPFLRKERPSEMEEGVVGFSEEFREEVLAAQGSKTGFFGTPRSLFSRQSYRSEEEVNKWFGSRISRKGSVQSDEEAKREETRREEEARLKQSMLEVEAKLNRASKSLSSMDIELLIETTHALVVEIFNLTTANNKAWMRRSILNLLREIVRRTYTEFISESYTDFVNENMSPEAIVVALKKVADNFWPEGQWAVSSIERTEEEKRETREKSRKMLMTKLIPSSVRQLIGEQNCNLAMDRIWTRIQEPDLNRVLVLQILERVIKPILG